MSDQNNFGFYSILTNPVRGYEYCAQCVVDAGIRYLQLRMKDTPSTEIIHVAENLRRITEGSNTFLIINDDPHIAQASNADGVHIGQDDISFDETRTITGPHAKIGLSTHSPDQTAAACLKKPDYIGIGPVFPTPTKKNPDPIIGIEGMKTMLSKASVPAVAIGGIDFSNLHEVFEAGAQNFCMVRQLTQSDQPQKILRKLMQIYHSYYPES